MSLGFPSQTEFGLGDEMIRLSDRRAHAHVLVKMGLMPPVDKVLAAVADARLKYGDEIVRARMTKKQDEAKRRESGEDKREFERTRNFGYTLLVCGTVSSCRWVAGVRPLPYLLQFLAERSSQCAAPFRLNA